MVGMRFIAKYRGATVIVELDRSPPLLLAVSQKEYQTELDEISQRLREGVLPSTLRQGQEFIQKVLDAAAGTSEWYLHSSEYIRTKIYPLLKSDNLYDRYAWRRALIHAAHKEIIWVVRKPNRKDLAKEIKQLRYITRQRHILGWVKLHPTERYGVITGNWLTRKIRGMVKRLDHVDNIRFARKNSKKEMRQFWKAKERGCCGSVNVEVYNPFFGRFMVGCNHGH